MDWLLWISMAGTTHSHQVAVAVAPKVQGTARLCHNHPFTKRRRRTIIALLDTVASDACLSAQTYHQLRERLAAYIARLFEGPHAARHQCCSLQCGCTDAPVHTATMTHSHPVKRIADTRLQRPCRGSTMLLTSLKCKCSACRVKALDQPGKAVWLQLLRSHPTPCLHFIAALEVPLA
jgi:hypothetical protein